MNLTDKQTEVLETAINRYGKQAQIDQAIEECAELIVELSKYKRERESNIQDEIADVFIMLKQLELMFDKHDGIQNRIDFKVERLQQRLKQ